MKDLKWLIALLTLLISLFSHNPVTSVGPQTSTESTEVTTPIIEYRDVDYKQYRSIELAVDNIMQEPELPTGCEVTALTIVLNHLGYDVDKLTLAESYLPKGPIGKTHPDDAFIGDPTNSYSYGANAPVLIKTARKYLDEVSSSHEIYDVSTDDFDSLLSYIANGHPVIFWATIYMEESYLTTKWTINNEPFQWRAPFHCMVLIGYTEDTYIIADPLQGIVEYDKDLVEQRYNELGNQALVIY